MFSKIKEFFTRSIKYSSDRDGWGEFWGRRPSSSGITVDEYTALSIPALQRGIEIICNDVTSLPRLTYSWENDIKKKQLYGSLYRLLNIKANRRESPRDVIHRCQQDRMLHGNGYIHIIRDENLQPVELWNLNPRDTSPFTLGNGHQNLVYYRTIINGAQRELSSDDVIHIKGLRDETGLKGYSIIELFADVIGSAKAGIEYQGKFFKKGARNPFVFTAPETMNPDARRQFQQDIQKGDINDSPVVLPNGMDIKTFGYSPKDLTLIELARFDLVLMSLICGLPASYLGSEISSSYSSFEMEARKLLANCIDPHLDQWESELNIKLLSTRQIDRQTHQIEFDRSSLENTDKAALNEQLLKQLQHGVISWNEYRSALGHTPNEDGWGDFFMLPENYNFVHLKLEQKELEIEKAKEPPPEPQILPLGENSASQDAPGGVQKENSTPNTSETPDDSKERLAALTRSVCNRLADRVQLKINRSGNHDVLESHLDVFSDSLEPVSTHARSASIQFLQELQMELDHSLIEQVKVNPERLYEVITHV